MLSSLGLLGFVQCILAIIAMLMIVQSWTTSNRLLLLVLFSVGIGFLRVFTVHSGWVTQGTPWLALSLFLSLSTLPLLHLLLSSLLNSTKQLRPNDLVHFIAPAAITALCFIAVINTPPQTKNTLLYQGIYQLIESDRLAVPLILTFVCLQLCIYLVLNHRLIKHYQHQPMLQSLEWAKSLYSINLLAAIAFISINVYSLIDTSITLASTVTVGLIIRLIFLLTIFFWATGLLKQALMQRNVEPIINVNEGKKEGLDPTQGFIHNEGSVQKYAKSGLSIERMSILHDRAITLITQKKLFLDSDVSLSTLAQNISCSVNHLSQAINTVANRNLNEILNELRIEEAKKQLKYQQSKNITDIAMDAGFNSKSSFYALFKQLTGQTPGAYKKQHLTSE
jgi:AraC-like DNA-binding protein